MDRNGQTKGEWELSLIQKTEGKIKSEQDQRQVLDSWSSRTIKALGFNEANKDHEAMVSWCIALLHYCFPYCRLYLEMISFKFQGRFDSCLCMIWIVVFSLWNGRMYQIMAVHSKYNVRKACSYFRKQKYPFKEISVGTTVLDQIITINLHSSFFSRGLKSTR